MLSRIDMRELARFFRRDLPRPIDVLNLIDMRRMSAYRWYAVLVAPMVRTLGGSFLWLGRHECTLHGRAPAEKLLVVRYRSHRRFLAMTMNPFYLLINRLRERGVTRFEASFMEPIADAPDIARHDSLVGVHFNSSDAPGAHARISGALLALGWTRAYAAGEASPFSFIRVRGATDPHPVGLKHLALFSPPPDPDLDGRLTQTLPALAADTQELAVVRYRREPASEYLPGRRLRRSAAGG